MTPKHWRHVRIEPHGKRFKVVRFYSFIGITEGDARVAGFESASQFHNVTKKQALEHGQGMEDYMNSTNPQRKRKRK